MEINLKTCAIGIVMLVVLGGAYKYDFRNASPAKTQPTALVHHVSALKSQNRMIKKAIDKIGLTDSGDAKVEYYKKTNTLRFVLLDMDAYPKFEHKLEHQQTLRFKRITHLSNVNSELIISHHARIRKMIQLHEEAQQRHLNQLRANKIKAKQQRKARNQKLAKLVKQLKQKRQKSNHRKPSSKKNHKPIHKNRAHSHHKQSR